MERIPYIDEHAVDVAATAERVWASLVKVLGRSRGGGERIARVLGCDPPRGDARFDGRPGQALPGFRVVEADPGRRLVLRGRHRFSRYEAAFVVDGGRLRVQTSAAFPGVRGRLYRAAVIGSGGHRLVTRHLLRQVARESFVRPDLAGARRQVDGVTSAARGRSRPRRTAAGPRAARRSRSA